MSYQSGNQYQTTSSLAVISLIGGIASYFILPVLGRHRRNYYRWNGQERDSH